jgi:L-alanine-DL-glutamate epimerase-like enolase superfamily enzyme
MNARSLAAVEVRPVRWPLRRPFVTALGRKDHSDNVLVCVRSAGGAYGVGEASSSLAMPHQTGPRMAAALGRLGRLFHGADLRDLPRWIGRLWAAEPELPTAVAAFETALWDALARAEGIPFAWLWGDGDGALTTLITLSVGSPETVARDARAAARRGFRSLKIKLNGTDPVELNRSRLRAAHGAAPRARFLLDANQSFHPEGLAALLDALRRDGLPVELVEEPFPKGNHRWLSAVRGRWSTPILLDESVQNAADARAVVRARLAQGANVKLAKSGLWGGREILRVFDAAPFRARMMIGCMAESSLGLAASVQFAVGLGRFDDVDLDSDLLLAPTPGGGFQRRGPVIRLPRRAPAGLGIPWPVDGRR